MADFRKAKYSGSLNLAPECGPVLIELDTDAKTATASLEDPASEYTLSGGGGGLTYVIPEQTVTISNQQATLQNINTSGMVDSENIILKAIINSHISYDIGSYSAEDDAIYITSTESTIHTDTGIWDIQAPENTTMTISAIRGF